MRIFIMALEPIDTRYTGQWYDGFPERIREEIALRDAKNVEVINVAGEQVSTGVTTGAFLDFSATNIWKNTQINDMAKRFADGGISAGDHVIFTDAWHGGVQQIKYMSELLGIPVTIHSFWHAGSYDPQDFLGRMITDKRWSLAFEQSVFHASNFNYFATRFHIELFLKGVFPREYDHAIWRGTGTSGERENQTPLATPFGQKIVRCGQPHNRLISGLMPFRGTPKKRQVLFPHRVSVEKQPDIFRDLAAQMPDVNFVVAQDTKLTKDEYHKLMAESQVVFSANLQETLGISAMEGVLVDTIPLLPDRLSYKEMYEPNFLYDSEWTESWEKYLEHRSELVAVIKHMLEHPWRYAIALQKQDVILRKHYLDCGPLMDRVLDGSQN